MISYNKKAKFEYEFIEEFICGIQLLGSEVTPLRSAGASIVESHCYVKDGEIFIKNLYVPESWRGIHYHSNPKREKKLLLTKKQINKISDKVNQKGFTLVPISVFSNDTGLIKVKIVLARGKKNYQKKETIKARDIDRDMRREVKLS